MNKLKAFLGREQGIGANKFGYDFALRRLCVAKQDSWRGISPSNYSSDFNPEPPIFSAKFANCNGYRHILAIANEDGKIALQNTTVQNHELEEKALSAPQCHHNAVFDLEWAPDQMKFVSASGDHTARLWEVDGSDIRSVRSFMGHTRSVKTAAFRRADSSVFATGGRDGAIIIWDTRANLNVDLTPRADNCILSGHVGGPSTPQSQRKRSRTPKMTANATSSSITGLAFQDSNTLISCGAGDGIIKVWDLRRNYTTYKREPHPKHSLPYAGSSTFKGFTNLIVDRSGAQLFANCMDNTIYCYNLYSYAPEPLAQYKGLLNSTFYIKACLSPDGKYLLSGSSDEKAYIWNLKYPDEPLVALSGHTVEVTCVAWGAVNDKPIVTCSDDARHKIWRIGPEYIDESDALLYTGKAEYVRQFGVKKCGENKLNLCDLVSTPRSLKRLVEQNERTPSSVEKLPTKRSFLDMLGATACEGGIEEQEQKRLKTTESRGRRLFSPSISLTARSSNASLLSQSITCLNSQLTAITEEQGNPKSNQENNTLDSPLPCTSNKLHPATTPSPLAERIVLENHLHAFTSVLETNAAITSTLIPSMPQQHPQSLSSVIFSPTSNLPNYVLDGEAPHLSIMSPKRKHKDKVDWLTKIRKQKLLSTCRGISITEKISGECSAETGSGLSSPRLRSLRNAVEGSPRQHNTPRRRVSHSGLSSQIQPPPPPHDGMSPSSSHLTHPRTPTSSRRNSSETTLLRFFSVMHTQNRSDEPATSSSSNTTTPASVSLSGVQRLASPPSPMSNNNTTNSHQVPTTCTQ